MQSTLSRRAFIQNSTLVLGGLASGSRLLAAEAASPRLRVGLVTDIHYADKPTRGSRHYQDSLAKLGEAVKHFNDEKPAFVATLGDLIDSGDDLEKEVAHLQTVERVLDRLRCERHYVLGNHCVDGLTKGEFIENTALDQPHVAFDAGGFRFIILDACFRSDGEPYGRRNFEWTDPNIPDEQVAWLEQQLQATDHPVVILAHQHLDDAGNHSVKNAPQVRKVLEDSERVVAVFQGHSHRDAYQQINGIHYCTQVAMVEGPGLASSAYGMLSLYDDGSLRVTGSRLQPNWTIEAGATGRS